MSDTSRISRMIETRELRRGRPVAVLAQASVCEYLAVVPEFDYDGFTGGFTALHLPTGRAMLLAAWTGLLTPMLVDDAILGVSDLDWSNPDPAFYRGEAAERHKQAWTSAVELTATDYYRHQGDVR